MGRTSTNDYLNALRIARRQGLFGGVHFKNPGLLLPYARTAADLTSTDEATTDSGSGTVAYFTNLTGRGVIDTTNWTADTYKTILSVSGGGLMAGYVGCTAGAAETHTLELTVDGVLREVAVLLASGERAAWLVGAQAGDVSVTTLLWGRPLGDLNAAKTILATTTTNVTLPSWPTLTMLGTPCLRFEQSLLVRAKHSASITNSTATAYSGVMYRKEL